MQRGVIWLTAACLATLPVIAATQSPLLAWRDPIYIAAGFAGVLGLAIIFVQPLLIAGYLPGLGRARRAHKFGGALLLMCVLLHVAGLWITSPPDVVDALLLRSPTPFSAWGVLAMWAVFITSALALLQTRLSARTWRYAHTALFAVVVMGTVVHALQIEGTMETVTKWVLCCAALGATVKAVLDFRVWKMRRRRKLRT